MFTKTFNESFKSLPKNVTIMEVGPRDGLQNEKTVVDTASKLEFIDNLIDAGHKKIEITAFVSPKWIPALADQLEVAKQVKKTKNVSFAALVPNIFGYERARLGNVDEVSIVLSASETHNKKNINATTAEAFERYKEVAQKANKENFPFRAYLSCTFGCPYEGETDVHKVLELTEQLLDLGAYEVSLSDTIGVATPISTAKVLDTVLKKVKSDRISLHMHDTRGMAIANIFTALQFGISAFDSASGGIGGCPYAKGASGNVATEDLVYLLDSMGITTGVNLNKICLASKQIKKILNRELPSKVFNSFNLSGLICEK